MTNGLHWYWAVFSLFLAAIIAVGRRSIFRAGVSRTPDVIVCRYIPWFEGSACVLVVGLPTIAIAMIVGGFDSDDAGWLPFGGIVLSILTPIIVFGYASMWRRCRLRISPSALTVELAAVRGGALVVSRKQIKSITPAMTPLVSGTKTLQVEIRYEPTDGDGSTKSLLLGPQLTVQPANLLLALQTWHAADGARSGGSIDRVECILRHGAGPVE